MDKALTTLELKVMNLLWSLKKAHVKDVLEAWPESPKPAYNTVSTIIRILEDKGYVDHEAQGRTYLYFPAVKKNAYQKNFMQGIQKSLFSGSLNNLVSCLIDNDKLTHSEIKDLEDLINKAK